MLSKYRLSAILKCKSTIATRDCSYYGYQRISVIKSGWIIWTGSNQTTKTPTSKRGSDGSGSSTSQSSSIRKFVRAWLKDFEWLAYLFEAKARYHGHWRSIVQLGSFLVAFSGMTNFILNVSAYNSFYVVWFITVDSNSSFIFPRVWIVY